MPLLLSSALSSMVSDSLSLILSYHYTAQRDGDGGARRGPFQAQGHRLLLSTGSSTLRYYNTAQRDGYLPVFKALSRHGVALRLTLADQRNSEQPQQVKVHPWVASVARSNGLSAS